MANIVDYLKWRGDILLDDCPFNDVDNLVLSLLSYLGFDDIVPSERSNKTVLLSDACQKMIESIKKDPSLISGLSRIDTTFLEALIDSPRFAKARLGKYVNRLDHNKNMQFAGLTIYLPNGSRFISYRGTDGTLVGWRENLDLSFKITAADKRAAQYLEARIREYLRDTQTAAGAHILVGGHSKGGNLDSTAHDILGEKYIRILPQFSVVGMIFNDPQTPFTIVKSSETGMMAHDGISWQVERDHFITCSDFTPECKKVNEAFSSWYTDLPLEKREAMTNELFDALEAGGAVYFNEITASGSSLRAVLAALMNTDRRTWSVFADLFGALVSASASTIREQMNPRQLFSPTIDTYKGGPSQ